MRPKLTQYLIDKGYVTEKQCEEALQRQVIFGGKLGTNLLELYYIDEEMLLEGLSHTLRVPIADPEQIESNAPIYAPMISRELAAKYRVIPFGESRGRLEVAMVNPLDFEATDELCFILGKGIKPYITSEMRMSFLLHEFYGLPRERKLISLPEIEFKRREAREERKKKIQGFTEDLWDADSDVRDAATAVPAAPAHMNAPLSAATDEGRVSESEPSHDLTETDTRGKPAETIPLDRRKQEAEPMEPERRRERDRAPWEDEQELGMDSLEGCVMRLGNVNSRYDIASILLTFSQNSLDRLILFAVENQSAYAINAGGNWQHFENLSEVRLAGSDLSLIHHVAGSNQIYIGPFPDLPAHRRVIETLGGPFPDQVVAFPMALKDKVFYVLYGDNGTSGLPLGNMDEIKKLTEKAALAFEMLVIRAKILFQG